MNLKRKIITSAGEYIGRDIMRRVSDFTSELENWTSKNPFNAKNANPVDEDKYMREYSKKRVPPVPPQKPDIPKLVPMQRAVSTWSKEDLDKIMRSNDYQYDYFTQQKVKSYFEWKYPGSQKLDFTGRSY